jgi:anti-sigma-K factor RskA
VSNRPSHERPSHEHPSHDDLYAYALGALDAGEERSIAKHVPYCERCSTELRERINPAVSVLAESVEQRVPPPELRERLLATVREEAEPSAKAEPSRAPRRGLGDFFLRPAVALTAVAVIAAGVAGYLVAGGDDQSAETVAFESTVSGAGASLELEGGDAIMTASGMPPVKKGAVYQVWVKEGEAVSPSASFVAGPDGSAMAALPEDLDSGDEVLVTEEPMAGQQAPSSRPFLSARVD